ncbi:unnamed protein product [Chilo suppressalis]|uniref:Peroxidase n=1 Tax=Chilo suppressalis TaxID=168631 RepID=A0ABN8AT39_CHISP|nr:unnamed protein product [Chilo suppressalis]
MTILLSGCRSVLITAALVCLLLGTTNGCYDCDWDFLTEELFPTLCPILSSTTTFLKDLFSLDTKAIGITATATAENEDFIPPSLVAECLKRGRDLSKSASTRGNQLVRSGASLDPYPLSLSNFFYAPLPPDLKKSAQASHEMLAATKLLQMKICSSSDVTPNTFMAFLEHQVIKADVGSCKPLSIRCAKDKFRSLDGTCNNLQKPGWGRRGAPFTRIAPPRYADGIYSMPVAESGRPLPNPRVLSTRLFTDAAISSRSLNYLNMQWGQFITHDLMQRLTEVTDEGGIQCCLGEGGDVLPPEWQNDKCIPIRVPDEDHFYRLHGVRCLNLVRSVTTPRDDCSLGYAEQINAASSYLDGSQIYSPDKKQTSKLRSRKRGRLREEYKTQAKRGYLPTVSDKLAYCDLRNISEPCYFAGDGRINQTPTLAMLHTLLLREHNRVADILDRMNPTWSDERIFQEARRIVIAELQHITYQEWLPLNFGESYFRYYRISPTSLYSHDYSAEVNAAVINSFAAAAFRYLHTLVPDTIMTCPANYYGAYLYKISDHYQNPSLLETSSESFDDIVRGAIAHISSEADPHCSSHVTNLMFKSHRQWGLDLIAMDIQRSRDHGIASYNHFREICGLRRAKSFQDLSGEITQDRIYALSQLYESVEDIDLFVGGAMERAVHGSILGHTFQCIVAEQFYRTRVGDRFFYDNGEMPHSFTTEQLRQLKKASMARLICDNTDVRYVQRNAFERESLENPKVHCDNYATVETQKEIRSALWAGQAHHSCVSKCSKLDQNFVPIASLLSGQPINVPTAGAQAFPKDEIGRLGHNPPRGPSAN